MFHLIISKITNCLTFWNSIGNWALYVVWAPYEYSMYMKPYPATKLLQYYTQFSDRRHHSHQHTINILMYKKAKYKAISVLFEELLWFRIKHIHIEVPLLKINLEFKNSYTVCQTKRYKWKKKEIFFFLLRLVEECLCRIY